MAGFDTVIVGAGAAGIAAARQLLAAGRHILVLEARHRVGGRAVTDQRLGAPADLGAAWLHFADENAWTGIAEREGFTIVRRKPGWGPDAAIGAHQPDAAEKAGVAAAYRQYFAAVGAAVAAGRDVPVANVLPQDAFRPRFDAVMTWAVGAESRDVSTLDLHRYAESRADWAVEEGLGRVVAAAAEGLPVQFGVQVTAINWSCPTVTIDSDAGRIEAASVIVTVPTSVLAHGAIRFDPPLPAAHQQAIEALPLGVCNKAFFRLEDAAFAASLPPHFMGSATTSRTCSWQVRAGTPSLLVAYFGGDLSRELEQQGALEDFARGEFTAIFGNDAAMHLGASLATAWASDPYSLGSYSAARPGFAHCREALAAPVSAQLHFAGEACSVSHYGTLHGAWLSGNAAAARLLPL